MYSKARTDSDFTPLPDPLPDFPAAGQTFTDDSFNSVYPPKYVRLTDASIEPSDDFGFAVATGGSTFNSDDTLLWVANNGASIFVFELVPETMQTGLVSFISGNVSYGHAYWSQRNPRWLYSLNPSTGKLWRIDFSGINLANPNNDPPVTLVFDFTTVGLTPPATFAGVGGNDSVFAAYFGAQDTSDCVHVAAYDAKTGFCSIYNTKTGTVDGVPALTPDTYILHGAHLPDPTGNWMWATRSDADPGGARLYAWAVGSPLVLPVGPYHSGHHAGNAYGFFNHDSSYTAGHPQLLFRRWQDFSTGKVIALNVGNGVHDSTLDVHPTTANDRFGLGGLPIFSSTNSLENTKAYQNEIIAWPASPGLVQRFGRTFSGMAGSYSGQNAIGAVSPSGRFFAVTSDGVGTLGPDRADVFIIALPE